MNFNDYYNYLNGINDMNYMPNTNQIIEDLNYQSLMPNNMIVQDKQNQSSNIINTEEGFKRGNMFKNLYNEYKNYKPRKLTASSEREDMLLQIMEYTFAMIDIGLYLDMYPNDKEALKLFNTYLDNKKDLTNMFEEKYGPLTIESDNQTSNWTWDNSPWPWEVQK